MAANGDVYEIVDVSVQAGQEVLNVYFYKRNAVTLVGNPAQQVADAYDGQMMPLIVPVQNPDILHTEIRVRNLYDPTDTYTKLISEAGESTDENSEAVFNAVGYKLAQDNGSIRNGAKRYGGLPSTVFEDGVVVDTGFITLLVALGVGLASGMDIGVIADALVPVIVKRILDGGNYRLPENSGEGVLGTVTSAVFNPFETSQTSRKIGTGV